MEDKVGCSSGFGPHDATEVADMLSMLLWDDHPVDDNDNFAAHCLKCFTK